jgi:hypothetical protein
MSGGSSMSGGSMGGTGTGSMGGTGEAGSGGRSYPTCSRSVTDNCMQRGGGSRRHHRR